MRASEEGPKSGKAAGKLAVWVATGFGVGFVPWAPGTFGTLLGLPLAWGLERLGNPCVAAALIVGLCAVGVPIVNAALPRLARGKDPGCVVLDEIVTLPMTFFLVPMSSFATVVVGFALHRLFDISKPPPARQLERLPGGLGVMADDWAAGVYSNFTLHALLYVAPSWFSLDH